MPIYATQKDIDANPDQDIQLYIPGETRLTAQDVFLGGTGTGVGGDQLNGATRVYGQDSVGTSRAFADYQKYNSKNGTDLSTNINAAITQNAAPRADAAMGMPTLARQQMEIGQAQDAVSNNMAQKTYDENLRQAALADTWKQKTFDYGVSQDAINNQYRQAALAASSAKAGSSGPSVSQLNYMDKQDTESANNDAFAVLNKLANQGKSRTEILNFLNQNSDKFTGTNYDQVLARAQKAFTWDVDTDGNWYNTWVDKKPE